MPEPTPLLEIENVTVAFPKLRGLGDVIARRPQQVVRALNGVSVTVERGETLGIVGESGCGKSTLARVIVRLVTPQSGAIRFRGEDVTRLRGGALRAYNRQVQLVFQDPYTSLNPRMTVRQMLAEALHVHAMRPSNRISERIVELLDLVRLPQSAADKFPHEFSGGQRQRIGIARALAVEPAVLVADELVSALDVSVQAQVVNLLLELQAALGLTVLFVAHDLRLVRHVSNRVAVIYLGAIVEIGPSESVFAAPRHPYSQALLAAAPSLDRTLRPERAAISGELPSPLAIPPGCPFNQRCPLAIDRCRSQLPALRQIGAGYVACHRGEETAPTG